MQNPPHHRTASCPPSGQHVLDPLISSPRRKIQSHPRRTGALPARKDHQFRPPCFRFDRVAVIHQFQRILIAKHPRQFTHRRRLPTSRQPKQIKFTAGLPPQHRLHPIHQPHRLTLLPKPDPWRNHRPIIAQLHLGDTHDPILLLAPKRFTSEYPNL
jgi:hypothetical protein